MKEQLLDHLNYILRHDLEPILLASTMLEEDLPKDKRMDILSIISRRIDGVINSIKHAQSFLHKDIFIGSPGYYPIDPRQPINAALDTIREREDLRGINFEIHHPEVFRLVLAEHETFTNIVKEILTVLLNDATEGSRVTIEIQETDQWTTYRFSNTGFGLPGDVFQKHLLGDQGSVSHQFIELRKGIQQIKKWGGEVEASSDIGVGIEFSVKLKHGILPM